MNMLENLSKLITEARNSSSIDIDLKSADDIVQIFNDENRSVFAAVESATPSIVEGAELITTVFRGGGRLIYIGAGTSGRLGVLDASECPPTFSTDPGMVHGIIAGGDSALRQSVEGAEDNPDAGARAIREHGVTNRDAVVGITSSGRTPYVIGALAEAHQIGAKTIFLSCVPPAGGLTTFVDVFITPIVGPEIVAGSTRMKAGTATKLVLNMLTTISMIKIGKVYNNLMVDVQASNAKMIDRGTRIIMEITNTDYATARSALNHANGSAKVAIIMLVKEVDLDDAVAQLERHKGFLREVLEEPRTSSSA